MGRANTWVVILGCDRLCLEKVGGQPLLARAIGLLGEEKSVARTFVGTDDPEVHRAALREGASLPHRGLVRVGGEGIREQGFALVDFLVEEDRQRVKRWGIPCNIIILDPLYPFTSHATAHAIAQGLKSRHAVYPVSDALPGLVMPVHSMIGHRYAPHGARPFEDYSLWKDFTREEWTVLTVPVGSAAEAYRASTPPEAETARRMANGRAFEFSVKYDYRSLYVPQATSWGAFLPQDADFVYEPSHDRRIRRPSRPSADNAVTA